MQKALLIILLLASVFYFFNERFDFLGGDTPDGKYTLVMVDTVNGNSYQLMGK